MIRSCSGLTFMTVNSKLPEGTGRIRDVVRASGSAICGGNARVSGTPDALRNAQLSGCLRARFEKGTGLDGRFDSGKLYQQYTSLDGATGVHN